MLILLFGDHLNYIGRDGFVGVKQMPIDHLEKKAKGKWGDADNGKDEMAKKEMSRKVVREAAGKFKIADEAKVAAELIKDWQCCTEEVYSIKEKREHWEQEVDKKVKKIVGNIDPFLISSIVFASKIDAWNVWAKYVYQGARPKLRQFQLYV